MTTTEQIQEILDIYRKFDWILRRVLLTDELKARLENDLGLLFDDAKIFRSDIDAAWFSRPGKNDREAWELRIFGEPPFALLESFSDEDNEEHREKTLRDVQTRMAEISSKKSGS